MKPGNRYGLHRVLEPKGVLPQTALRVDNAMGEGELYDNEILCDVETLNVDSASFTQIEAQAGGDKAKIAEIMKGIVAERGKHQNPVTGSGGMFIGRVNRIGAALQGKIDLKPGDRWLMCSDGLYNMVEDEEISRILSEMEDEEAADRLMELALENGGTDNITLVLCRSEVAEA